MASQRALEIRERLHNRKLSIAKIKATLPEDLNDIKDELGILELTAKGTLNAEKLSVDESGEKDGSLMLAGMVVKCLALYETRERIFTDNDMDAVADYGLSVLKPLSEEIKKISGVADPEAAKEAEKKDSSTTTGSSSASTSQNS